MKCNIISKFFFYAITLVVTFANGSNAEPNKLSRRAYDEIISGKDYMIVSQLSGKYITVGNNGNIHQWEKLSDTSSQVWRFESAGSGKFAILSGKMALTVENGNNKNGNKMILSQYQNNAAQRFIFHKTDDVYDNYYITAECSGNAALDVYDQSYDNGANIDQWDYWGGDNQKFYVIPVGGSNNSSNNNSNVNGAFLFAFFQGNAPEKEQLSYALSTDGYHFNILNYGRSIWKSNVGTGCIRDPFILKGQDDYYYLLATDMKSYLGWDSNRNILTAKSKDLIHWNDVTSIEIANKYPLTQAADRAWAPQAIYDPEKKSYMIYFAVRTPGNGNKTIMYYAYSKDMKKLDTAPALLFAPRNGNEAIDSDIIFQNNKYYMYYKDETKKTICLATADHASGPYQEIKQLSDRGIEVEGCNIYPVVGTNKWLMMSDAYVNGYFVLQETTDLVNFRTLDRKTYGFNFTPRHGYVIPISNNQYNDLLSAYPTNGISPLPVSNSASNNNSQQGSQDQNIDYTYPYCKTTSDVVYTDTMEWGVENNEWCIIKSHSSATCQCWAKKLGYPCCTDNTVYYEDSDGQWGIENNEWCGILKC
ncbi:hypothetical protein BCR36DRAFT_582100 [Piromyces finnis]|uniref:Endo-1,5-alpha-L-arabinanase A n=1 Tax=Piromyces finnis TaxID=1754191 RepID=A0A1Y1VEY8_9FUNG|nr:hypothetical protein BCR36DRAFT_582100 [Piromyces finnis]|eukprot:ORX53880.1 hypothetical protein BCR36DRAFT_582100 [Piromyces finnis]